MGNLSRKYTYVNKRRGKEQLRRKTETGSRRMRKLRDYRVIPPGCCLNCFLRRGRVCHCSSNGVDGDVRHRLLIMFMFSHISLSSHFLIFLRRVLQRVLHLAVSRVFRPMTRKHLYMEALVLHVRSEISCDFCELLLYVYVFVLNGCIYMYSQICEWTLA